VIFDPEPVHTLSAKTHHQNCDYNAYEGWQVKGQVRTVLLRGTVAIDRGQAFVGKGFGRFIHRAGVTQPLYNSSPATPAGTSA
jgi:dihydropyrimidinase